MPGRKGAEYSKRKRWIIQFTCLLSCLTGNVSDSAEALLLLNDIAVGAAISEARADLVAGRCAVFENGELLMELKRSQAKSQT